MKKIFVCGFLVLCAISTNFAQRKGKTAPAAKPKTIVFAVMNEGQTLEPIGVIDKGEMTATTGGDAEPKQLQSFAKTYYKPKTAYNLIFGGAPNGTVTVVSSNLNSECGKNLAQATTVSPKARIKGLVMGLATNQKAAKPGSGVRRLPTATERAEIESLVRAEFVKQGVSANAAKNLKYHNLTAVDADSDGNAEMVGSFWVETSPKERNLLFFIAEKNKGGKYNFGYSEYKKVTAEDLMGGAELKDLDQGIMSELLLDLMEYNDDATAEIFTVTQGFEGNSFNVYSREDGKWKRVFEGSNYHCAY